MLNKLDLKVKLNEAHELLAYVRSELEGVVDTVVEARARAEDKLRELTALENNLHTVLDSIPGTWTLNPLTITPYEIEHLNWALIEEVIYG
jgi:hypothetical protein